MRRVRQRKIGKKVRRKKNWGEKKEEGMKEKRIRMIIIMSALIKDKG